MRCSYPGRHSGGSSPQGVTMMVRFDVLIIIAWRRCSSCAGRCTSIARLGGSTQELQSRLAGLMLGYSDRLVDSEGRIIHQPLFRRKDGNVVIRLRPCPSEPWIWVHHQDGLLDAASHLARMPTKAKSQLSHDLHITGHLDARPNAPLSILPLRPCHTCYPRCLVEVDRTRLLGTLRRADRFTQTPSSCEYDH